MHLLPFQFIQRIRLFFLRRHAQSRLSIRCFAFDWYIISDICTSGFPNLFRQGLTSVSNGILNHAAGVFGDACVSAMSITGRCQHFMLSIALGIGQGFQPVSGFNFQAKKYARLRRAFRFTLISGMCVLVVFCTAGAILAPELVGLFQDDPKVLEIGGLALRFASISLLFQPLNITPNMLFQSTGKKDWALLLACFRGGLCFIPIILVLPRIMGLLGVQLAHPIADIITAALSVPFAIKFFKRLPKVDMEG